MTTTYSTEAATIDFLAINSVLIILGQVGHVARWLVTSADIAFWWSLTTAIFFFNAYLIPEGSTPNVLELLPKAWRDLLEQIFINLTQIIKGSIKKRTDTLFNDTAKTANK
eukprot:TRINITY_DN1594_c0_g1_i4.p1 TRINITY_DN1594_c0_g1~~TRINITY_DN1594_c0_g1_i4.p1  ORF type:complete len:111 (+),score=25.61 TRINITY_DN1594_c0_g1_i4:125-457(+)